MLVLGQASAELVVWCKKFCQSWARPGQNFQYVVKSPGPLGPGQGGTVGIWLKVLPILGPARTEIVAYSMKFCQSWARPGQNF